MKAYKYTRYVQGWHWSACISETIVYIPGADFIIYGNGKKYGINKDSRFTDEAKEYISDVESGKILQEYTGSFVHPDSKFVKKIEERQEEKTTYAPYALMDLTELEIDITQDGLQELMLENDAFVKEKQAFEENEKVFHTNLKNLILEK
jgi:hypothetical protein